jgi:ribosomal protein L40E
MNKEHSEPKPMNEEKEVLIVWAQCLNCEARNHPQNTKCDECGSSSLENENLVKKSIPPLPVEDKEELKFFDSNGNRVRPGDTITITSHYNYPHHHGKEATVFWDSERGMLKWKYTEVRRGKTFTTEEYFYGVHKFTRKQLE